MSDSNNSTSGGISVLGLLGVCFVVLKLTGYITWSWWFVTMPFWGGFAFLACGALLALVVYVLYLMYKHVFDKKVNKG